MNKLTDILILKNPIKVRRLLNLYTKDIFSVEAEIKKIGISLLQSYQDKKSYNITLRYILNAINTNRKTIQKELVATSSWPVSNKYGYLAGNAIHNILRNKPIEVITPKYYTYIPKYNLTLREYLPGIRLSKKITEQKILEFPHIKKLMKWLSEFQKIKPFKNIEEAIDLNDLESNLKILRNRKSKEIKKLDQEYIKIKKQIIFWSKKYNKTIVHGDLNPTNILIEGDNLSVIDFESVHRGDRVTDLANLSVYIAMLQKEANTSNDKIAETEKYLISAYEKNTKKMTKKELARFKTYTKYFDLLFKAYASVWSAIS